MARIYGATNPLAAWFAFLCASCLELWRTAVDVGPVAQVGVVEEVEAQLDADGILEGQDAGGAGMVRSAAEVEKIKNRRTRAVLSRFHRLRHRSRVAGDNLAVWLLRQGRDDGRWARGVAYRHRWILQRIWTDAAVGAAMAEAYGNVSAEEQGLDDLAFAERCVQRSQANHAAEAVEAQARRHGVRPSVIRAITGGRA